MSQINAEQTFVGNFAIKLRDNYKENTLKTHFLAQNHTVNLCCNRDSKITNKRTQKVAYSEKKVTVRVSRIAHIDVTVNRCILDTVVICCLHTNNSSSVISLLTAVGALQQDV